MLLLLVASLQTRGPHSPAWTWAWAPFFGCPYFYRDWTRWWPRCPPRGAHLSHLWFYWSPQRRHSPFPWVTHSKGSCSSISGSYAQNANISHLTSSQNSLNHHKISQRPDLSLVASVLSRGTFVINGPDCTNLSWKSRVSIRKSIKWLAYTPAHCIHGGQEAHPKPRFSVKKQSRTEN